MGEQPKPFGEWARAMKRREAIEKAGKAGQQLLTQDAERREEPRRLWEGSQKKDSCEARVNKILATIPRRK